MNTNKSLKNSKFIGSMIVMFMMMNMAYGSIEHDQGTLVMQSKKLDGPRLGVSVLADKLPEVDGQKIGPVISQFGWQFEWLIRPENGGPAFLTEVIPFIGGVEYGIVIPSISVVSGIRFPFGFEFGMGPHAAVHFKGTKPIHPSLIVAVGQTFEFSGVNIPLNLAMTNSSSGQSFSFLFGYAIPSFAKF